MKVSSTSESTQKFQPITVTLVLETQDEAISLLMALNRNPNVVERDEKNMNWKYKKCESTYPLFNEIYKQLTDQDIKPWG